MGTFVPEGLDAPGLGRVAEVPVGPCPVCGGTGSRARASGFDYEIATCANRWTFVQCTGCGHVFLDPRPAPEALGTIYPPTYYAYNYATAISPVARRVKDWLDRRKFRGVLRDLRRPPTSYLDVGCGDGRFLDLMAGHGVPPARVWGLELDAAAVARVRARGFPCLHGPVEECVNIPGGSLDLITMFHVIEHLSDPAAVVRRLADWLTPGGILALETPNLDALDARLFGATWWGGYHFPRHWHLFTSRTLQRLLEDAGLTVTSVRYQTGHSFWLYSFHHALRYGRHAHPRLARLFDPVAGSLLALAAVTAFDKVRALAGARTSAMLVTARKG